jgi:hypothetical protein
MYASTASWAGAVTVGVGIVGDELGGVLDDTVGGDELGALVVTEVVEDGGSDVGV